MGFYVWKTQIDRVGGPRISFTQTKGTSVFGHLGKDLRWLRHQIMLANIALVPMNRPPSEYLETFLE